MADQVELDRREEAKEKNDWYPLRRWWQPCWAFNQDCGQTPLQDPGWWGMDLLQRGWSSGRPWPECTSSPLIVPMHPGSGYGCPPGSGVEQAVQYKWRVVLDVAHFAPSEIWIGTAGGVLEIRGKHTDRSDEHGSIARSFTRKYRLPIGIDFSKITSMLSGDGIMYVEAPLTEFTAPANIVIPIQVEREVPELRQGEKYPEDMQSPPEAAPSAPGDPGSVAPEPPTAEAAPSAPGDPGSVTPEPPTAEAAPSAPGDPGSVTPEPTTAEAAPSAPGDPGSVTPEPTTAEAAPSAPGDPGSVAPEPPTAEAAPSAPGDPGSVAPEPPTGGIDRGGASLAPTVSSVEAPTGSPMDEPPQHDMGRKQDEQEEREQVEEGKEQEARGEVAEEPSSAAGPGEGPENLPTPMEHHQAPEESPESPGTTPSDQQEEAGNTLLEPQPEESSGETTVEATQMEVPTEDQSP